MTNNVRDGRYYLTGPQRHVLTLMDDGWMACWMGPPDPSAFVQQGRIGYGGKSENVRRDTLAVLHQRGLVRVSWSGNGSTHYVITATGHAAVANGWTPTGKAR